MVSDRDIDRAAAILRDGGLVAFPTETVYGLGADASNPAAVRKIFEAKGRPADHPVIVHLADTVEAARWTSGFPAAAQRLAAAFWPGPLTLVLPRAAHVNDVVTGGQHTVGLRVPSHPVAQRLLARCGGGIAAPSANRHGRVSPTAAAHVRSEFGDGVGCVLDGGDSQVGIESTIVDLSGAAPALLRPGAITAEQVEAALGMPLAEPAAGATRAPGTLPAHYAPRTPLKLMQAGLAAELATTLARQGRRVAVLALSARRPIAAGIVWAAAPADAAGYAHALYATLRRLDEAGCDCILVEQPPHAPEWMAVNDRLGRAAAGTAIPGETRALPQ